MAIGILLLLLPPSLSTLPFSSSILFPFLVTYPSLSILPPSRVLLPSLSKLPLCLLSLGRIQLSVSDISFLPRSPLNSLVLASRLGILLGEIFRTWGGPLLISSFSWSFWTLMGADPSPLFSRIFWWWIRPNPTEPALLWSKSAVEWLLLSLGETRREGRWGDEVCKGLYTGLREEGRVEVVEKVGEAGFRSSGIGEISRPSGNLTKLMKIRFLVTNSSWCLEYGIC